MSINKIHDNLLTQIRINLTILPDKFVLFCNKVTELEKYLNGISKVDFDETFLIFKEIKQVIDKDIFNDSNKKYLNKLIIHCFNIYKKFNKNIFTIKEDETYLPKLVKYLEANLISELIDLYISFDVHYVFMSDFNLLIFNNLDTHSVIKIFSCDETKKNLLISYLNKLNERQYVIRLINKLISLDLISEIDINKYCINIYEILSVCKTKFITIPDTLLENKLVLEEITAFLTKKIYKKKSNYFVPFNVFIKYYYQDSKMDFYDKLYLLCYKLTNNCESKFVNNVISLIDGLLSYENPTKVYNYKNSNNILRTILTQHFNENYNLINNFISEPSKRNYIMKYINISDISLFVRGKNYDALTEYEKSIIDVKLDYWIKNNRDSFIYRELSILMNDYNFKLFKFTETCETEKVKYKIITINNFSFESSYNFSGKTVIHSNYGYELSLVDDFDNYLQFLNILTKKLVVFKLKDINESIKLFKLSFSIESINDVDLLKINYGKNIHIEMNCLTNLIRIY